MPKDYVIARLRIRLDGPLADPGTIGLGGFAPFAAGYDPAAPAAMVMETGAKIDSGTLRFTELTRFDFDGGRAVCRFGRSSADGSYVLTIGNGACEPMVFLCDSTLGRARCNAGAGGPADPALFRFGMWFMTGLAAAPHLTSAVHSSTIVCHGRAVMFLGESGTGKSTHTRLWLENIEGATLLNDDSPFVAVSGGKPVAFGSPWSGKTPCYRNECHPISAIVRLSQAPHNAIRRLSGAEAIGALLPSLPPAFACDSRLEEMMLDTLAGTVAAVPMYHLECRPDREAALTVRNTIFGA